MIDVILLQKLLTLHEGLRLKPYTDTVGKLTIGVGRNLTDVGISPDEANYLLENDIRSIIHSLSVQLPWFVALDPIRQLVLADMAFNLGINGLLGFHQTLSFIQAGDYTSAAHAMLMSHWAFQVSYRATDLAQIMHTGVIPPFLVSSLQ